MSTPADQVQQQLEIRRIYTKDISFEAPNSPSIFLQEWKPETKIQISTDHASHGDGWHEVVLTVQTSTTIADKTAYLVEIKQAGLFRLQGFQDAQLSAVLGAYCPNMLYPFAREAIADMIGKGGFPVVLLAPVNFDAMYATRLQQAQKNTAAQPPSTAPDGPKH